MMIKCCVNRTKAAITVAFCVLCIFYVNPIDVGFDHRGCMSSRIRHLGCHEIDVSRTLRILVRMRNVAYGHSGAFCVIGRKILTRSESPSPATARGGLGSPWRTALRFPRFPAWWLRRWPACWGCSTSWSWPTAIRRFSEPSRWCRRRAAAGIRF